MPESAEQPRADIESTPLLRPPTGRLRVEAFAGAIGATPRNAFPEGFTAGTFTPGPSGADVELPGGRLLFPDLFSKQFETIFPRWFVKALADDRKDLLRQAAAFALPMFGRLLDEMSATVAAQIDPEMRRRLSKERVDSRQLQVLVRGLLRQVLQILAGSEAAVAAKAAEALLNPVPGTPAQLIDLLARVVLWAIGYDTTEGHSAVLLTMGRDSYRGRLTYNSNANPALTATLPSRVLDMASATHERVLREIASNAWHGELRTNPGWTTLSKRVTVHSQGGCPMGEPGRSVTDAKGEVYGCEGLYVMDAAAFPTSVGVNPSATIAAIAEYKVEQFIRTKKGNREWRARDHDDAQKWIKDHGAAAIDPLNRGRVETRQEPVEDVDILALRFDEEMYGFFSPAKSDPEPHIVFAELERFPNKVSEFLDAESSGIAAGLGIHVVLHVKAPDLARLVSTEPGVNPARLNIVGDAEQAPSKSHSESPTEASSKFSFNHAPRKTRGSSSVITCATRGTASSGS